MRGFERFAKSNGISYKHARAEMIDGDADAGWRHLEYARDNKDKAERACVKTTVMKIAFTLRARTRFMTMEFCTELVDEGAGAFLELSQGEKQGRD